MKKHFPLFVVCSAAVLLATVAEMMVHSQPPANMPSRAKRVPRSLLTSEPVNYIDKETIARYDAMIRRAGPVPKYEQQMADIVGQRCDKEEKDCNRLQRPLKEKARRIHAILVGGDKEKERIRASHFTKPFNVKFPPIYEDAKK